MNRSIHRSTPKHHPRNALWIIGIPAAAVIALILAGCAYQMLASAMDARQNPPPGRLVDVGGYRMHIDCAGTGTPTVILDSGLGDTWLTWHKVQRQVASFTRVCSYDRAGLGWSDPSPRPRTSQAMAEELHTLLRNAHVDGPYIMVGHSFGGFDVRLYNAAYPGEVVGMVLVDATHPDQYKRLPPQLEILNNDFLRKENIRRELIPFGISRIMGWCGQGPSELRAMLRTVDCRLQPWREHLAEWNDWNISADEVRNTPSLGNMPLIVISHDPSLGLTSDFDRSMNATWSDLQNDLASLSTDSSHVIATASSHVIQEDRPDLVVASIHRIVMEVRTLKLLGNPSL